MEGRVKWGASACSVHQFFHQQCANYTMTDFLHEAQTISFSIFLVLMLSVVLSKIYLRIKYNQSISSHQMGLYFQLLNILEQNSSRSVSLLIKDWIYTTFLTNVVNVCQLLFRPHTRKNKTIFSLILHSVTLLKIKKTIYDQMWKIEIFNPEYF